MKSVAFLCFVACVVLAAAFPVKPDERDQQIRVEKEIAAKDLEAFKKAFAEKDYKKLAEFTQFIVNVAGEAQANNVKLVKGLPDLIELFKQNTSPSLLPIDRFRLLNLIKLALDENRDKLSSYRLDAVREWLERRTQKDGAHEVAEFKEARTAVVEARDALETMASTFVDGLEQIGLATAHIFIVDKKKIQKVVDHVVSVADGNKDKLIEKTSKTSELLAKVVDDWKKA